MSVFVGIESGFIAAKLASVIGQVSILSVRLVWALKHTGSGYLIHVVSNWLDLAGRVAVHGDRVGK